MPSGLSSCPQLSVTAPARPAPGRHRHAFPLRHPFSSSLRLAVSPSSLLPALAVALLAAIPSARAAAPLFDPERGLPLLQRFLPDTYHGHYQINDLAIAADGRFYGTSQRALHRYDGARWERLPYPALWAWRVVATPDGRVYVSGDDEIGYYADDPQGRPVYRSLVAEVPAEALPLGSVRGARASGDTVAFAAEKGWLVWQRGRFHFTPPATPGRTLVHTVGDTLYAASVGGGLLRWDGSAWQPFAAGTPLARATVTGLAALPGNRLLALTAPPGLVALSADGSTAAPWTGPGAATLLGLRPLGLLTLPDGRIAAFTRSSGLALVTPDGAALTRLDKSHGLPANTTYGLVVDRDGGLWSGGTNGLVRVDLATPASVFDERNGPGPGGMRSFTRQDDVLYTGVVDAVHRLVPADPATGAAARFEALPATGTTINDIAPHPSGLLVAATNTLYQYRPDTGFKTLLKRPDDLTVVVTTPDDPARVYLGGDKHFVAARFEASGLVIDHEAPLGYSELITPVGADTVWVGTRAGHFVRLRAAAGPAGWRNPVLERFGQDEGLPPTRGYTLVYTAPWGPAFYTAEGTWQLDETRRRFSAEPAFQLPDGPHHGFPGTLARDGRFWAAGGHLDGRSGRPLGWYEVSAGTPRPAARWHTAPAALQPLGGAGGFIFFYRDPVGDVLWGKSAQAVVRLETARLAALPAKSWRPRLHSVSAAGTLQALAPAAPPVYPASSERLVFQFNPGRLDAGAVTWRTRLVGHDRAWSAPSPHPEITYTNLEGGPFTLEAVATDAAGTESTPLRFRFSVAPPWHRSPAARISYVVAALGVMFGFLRWRLGRAERERLRLEALVADRTRALAAARDQAEAASRAKSAFLAAMSHELRTPLNGVIGYAQLLQNDTRLVQDQRERLRIVHQSGEHLLRMINDVLDLAKIEAGKIELRPAPFALAELLADVAAAHAPAAAAKRLAFHRDLAPDLPAWVEGDAQKLRQVLDNLLGNAVKFTARGAVTLRVARAAPSSGPARSAPLSRPAPSADSQRSTLNAHLPGEVLHFAVLDTGPGISAGDQARLFQPFEQARATRPAAPGTGLGLAISRALVERMGGLLAVTSEVGSGSVFAFTVALPALAAPAHAAATPAVTGYDGPRRRVLIVDDHAVNRSLLSDLLGPLGFDCTEADSGEAALVRLASGAEPWPDLAIIDLRMDGMDGLELSRRLRAQPRGATLRILLTSASVISFNATEARAAGCDDFLPKPFRSADLIAKLGTLLALAWHEVRPASRAPFEPSRPTVPIPPAALAALRDVLAQGDLDAFRSALAGVRAEHPAHAAFWDELDTAAAGFQLSRLRTLLD